jgi:hypothetical protein
VKESSMVMYPEFETLDYNCQRSELGEQKLILQFRKFIVKQTGTIGHPKFCR